MSNNITKHVNYVITTILSGKAKKKKNPKNRQNSMKLLSTRQNVNKNVSRRIFNIFIIYKFIIKI